MSYKIRTQSKSQELKRPDEWLGAVDRLGLFALKHARTLLILGGTVILIGGAAGAYLLYQGYLEKKAMAVEFEADHLLRVTPPTEEEGPSKDENEKKAIELYQKVMQEYPGTRSAAFSGYSLGNLYVQSGRYPDAMEAYRAVLKKKSIEDQLKSLVLQRLGYAQIKSDQWEEAGQSFLEAANLKKGINKDLSYFEAGRIKERLDKKEEAIKAYQEIINKYPTSMFLTQVQERLTGLGVTEVKPPKPAPDAQLAPGEGAPADSPADQPAMKSTKP